MKKEVGEAAEATREFTAQEMQDYADSLNKKLEELDTQLDQLQQKGQELAGVAGPLSNSCSILSFEIADR